MPVLRCERKPQCPEERISSRRSIFPAKDNRHNLLRPCVTCITFLYVPSVKLQWALQTLFEKRSFPEKTSCPSPQRVKRPRTNGLRLKVIFYIVTKRAQRSRNTYSTAYGKKLKPFKLDSQRSHWANVLDRMTRLYILQGNMYER